MSHIPSLTTVWHSDTYPAIDPKRRTELSLSGGTVIITGGGSGIGRAIAVAFAEAGVASIAVLGRGREALEETKQAIQVKYGDTAVTVYPVDVTDIEAVQAVAREVGRWDVLVSNAGYLSTLESLVEADPHEWWRAFEVHPLCPSNVNP